MKTALLLSGQPRKARENVSRIFDNLIKPLGEVDIFYHMWYDEHNRNINKRCPGYENMEIDKNIDNELNLCYAPHGCKVESPKTFKRPNIILTDDNIKKCFSYGLQYQDFRENYINNSLSFWYSTFQANLLKRLYELQEGFIYDLVIKCRFDVAPTKNIEPIKSFKENEIFYQDLGQPDMMISDWLFAGTSPVMDQACNLFNNWDQCYTWAMEHDGYWCNELLLKHQVLAHGIEPRRVDIGVQF